VKPVVRWGLFALVCVAQLWAAGSGIARYERTLRDGESYRFECAPVDPEDPFRGRYVALAFEAETTTLAMPGTGEADGPTRVYAILGRDEHGFAQVTALASTPPDDADYLRVSAYVFGDSSHRSTRLTFPFRRYFMEESAAKTTEADYRRALRSGSGGTTYATVRVRDGFGVIESLVVDGVDTKGAATAPDATRPGSATSRAEPASAEP